MEAIAVSVSGVVKLFLLDPGLLPVVWALVGLVDKFNGDMGRTNLSLNLSSPLWSLLKLAESMVENVENPANDLGN